VVRLGPLAWCTKIGRPVEYSPEVAARPVLESTSWVSALAIITHPFWSSAFVK
jgi:hypothetical protein